MLIGAMAVLFSVPHAAAAGPLEKTAVTVFNPPVPSGPQRSGECWTDSIAVARAGAWRCMVGNEIYDPCFSNQHLSGVVICDANPATGRRGFLLKLSKPLPQPSSERIAHPRPWLLKLADGSICEIQTGTTAFVAGLVVPYDCSDSHECTDNGCPYMTGLTGKLKRGRSWIADKVAFSSSDQGLKLLSRKRVAVVAVWE